MTAASTNRRLFAVAAALTFPTVFFVSLFWERPGLGLPHFFYIAIAFAALAAGPRVGAASGLLAAGLYVAIVIVNPAVPTRDALTTGTAIRTLTFVSMGTLIGWFAEHNRELMTELRILAQRDSLTGLPNTRAFEAAITRRLEAGIPFGLLLGDVDALMAINREQGHAYGNDVVRALAELLQQALGPHDEIARVGGDEFAVLASTHTADEVGQLAKRLERLATERSPITFGWSSFPQDGENALSLYRAADERLYARKLVRGRRLGDGQSPLRAVTR